MLLTATPSQPHPVPVFTLSLTRIKCTKSDQIGAQFTRHSGVVPAIVSKLHRVLAVDSVKAHEVLSGVDTA